MLQSSMGSHKLDVRYGDRNSLPYYNGVLDTAIINRTDKANVATAGKVMSLTTAGRLTPGLSSQGEIPYYSWSGLDINNYPDVQRDRGMPGYLDKPSDGIGGPGSPGWPGIPTGAISDPVAGGWATIQHIASAELSTTAFLVTPGTAAEYAFNGLVTAPVNLVASEYAPGTPLTVVSANAGAQANEQPASVGLLCAVGTTNGAALDSVIVGYVAPAGAFVGPEGYLTLAFTPAYATGTNVPALDAAGAITDGAPGVPLA